MKNHDKSFFVGESSHIKRLVSPPPAPRAPSKSVLTLFFAMLCFLVLRHEYAVRRDHAALRTERLSAVAALPNIDKAGANDANGVDPGDLQAERGNKKQTPRNKQPALPPPSCLKYVIYDKPPKTGSTSVSNAISNYLGERGSSGMKCINPTCLPRLTEMCAGTRPLKNLYGHVDRSSTPSSEHGVLDCLRDKGMYIVTSIRDPRERWDSFYFYMVRRKNIDVFGTNYANTTYPEFRAKYPACALFHYYDGLGGSCDGDVDVDERIRRIVRRYDEVFEPGEKPVGELERRLAKYVEERNKSARPEHYKKGSDVDESRLDNETKLYDALKRLRDRPPNPERKLC